MVIPDSFKRAQAILQDKTIKCFLPVETKGSLGTVTVKPSAQAYAAFKGNFQIVTDVIKAQEYGLTVNRDAVVTAAHDVGVSPGDFLTCGSCYRVVGIAKHDSHTKYLLKAVE